MADTAHKLQVTVGNVSDECTAVAIATDWLRDELSEIDIAQADASVGTGETRVDFALRMTEEEAAVIQASDVFSYLGSY